MIFFTPNIDKLEKKKNIPELVKCLYHKNAHVRYSAFAALSRISDLGSEIITKLKTMLDDPDPWIQSIATLKFAERGDDSISENLMEIAVEGSRNARIELLKIIADRGPTEDQAIIRVMINTLADKNEIVRRQAIITAGETRNAHLLPYLSECLREKHHDLRIQAAKALYNIAGEESVDYLIGLLADKNPEVRDVARSYLASIEYEYVQKALYDARFTQLVKDMNDREPVRRNTARKIGDELIREGLPLLHRACADKYKGVRVEALKSMAAFSDPSSIEFAAKLLKDKFRDVRIEAVHTLGQITDARSLEVLKSAVENPDKRVSEAAQKACERMKLSL